jgi:hypothetical protein
MYPPTDAVPLAPRPNLDHYKGLAKELLAASADSSIDDWAARWLQRRPDVQLDAGARDRLVRFATAELSGRQTLATAQRVIARLHGFGSWPRFAAHMRSLRGGEVAVFECAVDAVISGDVPALREVLAAHPELVRASSTRAFEATLLHYTTANGVENDRQRATPGAVAVATTLLDAGAEVDAPHHPAGRGGPGTALGLAATSSHLRDLGTQIPLMSLLVTRGAGLDGAPGGWQPLMAAINNACLEAAAWLVARGARVTLPGAAGLGRRDLVARFLPGAAEQERELALIRAATYGHSEVVSLLLDHGVDVGANDGQSALHLAAHGGHLETLRLLLARGAPLEALNQHGGTPLGQALWAARNHAGGWGGLRPGLDYTPIVTVLLAAGARVDPDWSTGIPTIDELLRTSGRQ